jgi:hypothetical protein
VAKFDVSHLRFQPRRHGLLVRCGELPIYLAEGAASAERDSRHGGYRFVDSNGRAISYLTDALLNRCHRSALERAERLEHVLALTRQLNVA